MEKNDNVNHPAHYKKDGYPEVIEVIEDATFGTNWITAVCIGNVVKYILRFDKKNGLEDIKKALWYAKYMTNQPFEREADTIILEERLNWILEGYATGKSELMLKVHKNAIKRALTLANDGDVIELIGAISLLKNVMEELGYAG